MELKFYKDSSSLRTGFNYVWGKAGYLVPAILAGGLAGEPWLTVGVLAGLGALSIIPEYREYVKKLNKPFSERWFRYRWSNYVSERLRKVYENAGLSQEEIKEYTVDGKLKRERIMHYPKTWIEADDYNYYLRMEMLPGQTSKQWEGKLDAFAQALKSDLVGYEIGKGFVRLTLQHTAQNVAEIIRKTDEEHYLYIGYKPGGLLKWEFDSNPNMLVVGVVGAGKSTFVRNILSQIPKSWTLRIVDGKQVEFTYMKDLGYDVVESKEDFLRYIDEALEEMNRRYEIMSKEMKNHYWECPGLKPYFLVCDEWISLVESLAKKPAQGEKVSERDRFFEKLKTLATKGRAAGIFLIAILQRPDAEFLTGLVRDMFTCRIVLKGSKMAFKMAFDDDGKELVPLGKGQGYCMMETITAFSFPNYTLDQFVADLRAKRASSSGRLVLVEAPEVVGSARSDQGSPGRLALGK